MVGVRVREKWKRRHTEVEEMEVKVEGEPLIRVEGGEEELLSPA